MDRKLACEIVKDLLPLYVDGMTSDVSAKSIESHLEHCADCNEIYQNMVFQLEKEKRPEEVPDVKRFLNKTKKMYLLYGFLGLGFIAILVCMIVDLAVNRGITWSLIVGSAVGFADALVYVFLNCKKFRCCAAMAVISIGTFFLLSVIQVTGYYLMGTGTFWLFRYGFPILLLWLVILWTVVLGGTFLKWSIWDCTALLFLFSIAGNYFTKVIIGDYVWNDVLQMREFMGNAFGNLVGGILFGVIGRFKKRRAKI